MPGPKVLVLLGPTAAGKSELARRLALSGFGIAPLNAYTASVSLPAKGLVLIGRQATPRIDETIYLVTRKRKWPNPLAEHLVKTFRIPPQAHGPPTTPAGGHRRVPAPATR